MTSRSPSWHVPVHKTAITEGKTQQFWADQAEVLLPTLYFWSRKAGEMETKQYVLFYQNQPCAELLSQSSGVKRVNNPRIKPLYDIVPLCGSSNSRSFAKQKGGLICTMCIYDVYVSKNLSVLEISSNSAGI